MRKNVFDITDLQAVSPFFRGRVGKFVGNQILKWLSVDKVNGLHARHYHLRGADFTSALLKDIGVSYQLHGAEELDRLPQGAFITVSNHPFGSIDGIMLIDVMARRRPEFAVMVNGILTKIEAMEDNFIAVKPDSKKRGANVANVGGVRTSLDRLSNGYPMGFFPAGAISMYDKTTGKIEDIPWTVSIIRLVRRAKVPIYPIFFDGLNSSFFYFLARLDWRIRTLRIPAEVFNKRGRCFDIYIGKPISVQEQQQFQDDESLAEYLKQKTYQLKLA